MTLSPTQRSLAYARKQGWEADVVERWIPGANIRKDLFGFIDLLVIARNEEGSFWELIGVQATSGPNHAARRNKAIEQPAFDKWRRVAAFEVWSWDKRNMAAKRGARKVWTLRRERL